ncbi:hypothetical protein ACRN96_22600 [Shewanella oncorhynchi]|uniref:hypothetical protein n=1 Tax=Shewanella oncorhynchi TaxID=2726434 RepID=UPI003D798D28
MQNIDSISKLAVQSGWYLCDSMIIGLPSRIKSNPDFDSVMVDMIEESWDGMWSVAFSASNHRSEILREAKTCHESGLYAASIHILLSQTDGIFYDKFKESYYKREGKLAKSSITDFLSQVIESKLHQAQVDDLNLLERSGLFFLRSYIASVSHIEGDVAKNIDKNEDGRDFVIPNRHGVLHGMHTHYPSKRNSLKCFSLMLFVATIIGSNELIGM